MSNKRNVILDIDSIPRWLLAQLAAICTRNKESQSTGEVRIEFIKGRVNSIYDTTRLFAPPGDSQELPAIQKKQQDAADLNIA